MKKSLKVIFLAFLIFGFFSWDSGLAQPTVQKKISLSELIEEALRKNPRLKAAYSEWQASLEKIPQAKSLPDPVLGYAHFGQSIETRLGPQRNKLSLFQKIPFFGKLSLKGKIAERGASVQEAEFNRIKAEIILKVKMSFFSLYWLDKVIRITQEEKEVLQRLARIARKKYEAGQTSQQDVLKALLEISRVEDKILILKQRRKAVAAELNSLLNRAEDSFLGEVEEPEIAPLEIDLKKLYSIAEEKRPELKKAEQLIEKSRESLKLAKKNYYPDFTLRVDYIDIGGGTTSHPEDGRNSWMSSVGINIPIWRSKLKGVEAEATLRLKASQEQYKDIKNETLSRVNELFFEVKTVQEQIELYKYSLIPQAEQSFKAAEVGYLAGKIDFLNLLDSERMVLLIKTGYHKALADWGKSLARLERFLGQDISIRGQN